MEVGERDQSLKSTEICSEVKKTSHIMANVFKRDTEKRRPCAGEDRMGFCDHKPMTTIGHQKLEEAGRSFPYSLQRDHSPADTLISDFWPPEL